MSKRRKELPWKDIALAHRFEKQFKLHGVPIKGDVLCFSTPGIVGFLIKRLTESKISHTALCIDDNGMIIHARVGYGVISEKLSDYMSESPKIQVWIKRLKPGNIPDAYTNVEEALRIVTDYAVSKLNQPYDNAAIFSLAWRSLAKGIPVLGKLLFKIPLFQTRLKFFCSELVNESYQQVGISFSGSHDPSTTTPGDIYKSNHLTFIESF